MTDQKFSMSIDRKIKRKKAPARYVYMSSVARRIDMEEYVEAS